MNTEHGVKEAKVAAVVVTYNRLDLLKECMCALKMQSYKNFDIVIINNGSTDGTTDYLSTQKDIIVINQDNCGGAGGFYTGMKYMFEKGYDALWMMDDDGIPDSKQLEVLVFESQKYELGFSNAIVINRNNHSETSDHEEYDKDKFEKMDVIFNKVCPFNGTLIWREVIERNGFIKKEMFIWGDEVEYLSRTIKNGFKVGTLTRAIHFHPEFKTTYYQVFPFIPKPRISLKPKPKDKLFFRNIGYLDANYKSHNIYRYLIYYLVRFKFHELAYFFKYYRMGFNNNFRDNLL